MKALIFNIQKFSLHDGKGIRTTVFFNGCALRCKWCANPESFSVESELMNGGRTGDYYTVDELTAEILKDKPFFDKSGGGVTLSGGEPLLQPEFVAALCDKLSENGVSVGIETSAHVPCDIFEKTLKNFDFAYIDLKHWNDDLHRQGTGAGMELILTNIRCALKSCIPVTIRIPIIPGYNNSDDDAREFSLLLKKLGAKTVHALPFHQLGESKYNKLGIAYAYSGVPQFHDEDVEGFVKVLASNGIDAQIGG